ncbi:MAG: CPBP family intramembrane metalloprotease [Erysipelotrichaceae bacterium]|nr:CPBP family intramembrane metalloprotease [Erysipelotrichaceae bacterium]
MSESREQRVSRKYARKNFSTVGLLMVFYVLFILVVPLLFHYYLVQTGSDILQDGYLYFGIYFIILLFGTLIPFFIMRKYFRIPLKKFNRSVGASLFDLFIQTIVCFTICIVLTYVSNMLFAYVGLEGKLVSSIGLTYDEKYLGNIIFIFMLIIVTPIIEEYAFRGVLLSVLGQYGKNFALYASAILFALAHLNFSEFLPAFAMGLLLGKTALRYRSIKPTILIHFLFNGIVYLMFILPPYITKYMAYGFAALFVISIYFILSGIYERVYVQKLSSNQLTYRLFFMRPAVVFCILLLIAKTFLYMFMAWQ